MNGRTEIDDDLGENAIRRLVILRESALSPGWEVGAEARAFSAGLIGPWGIVRGGEAGGLPLGRAWKNPYEGLMHRKRCSGPIPSLGDLTSIGGGAGSFAA